MNEQRVLKTIFDNTIENFIMFSMTKQQTAFFPKEESQMFQGKTANPITGVPTTETEDTTTRAIVNRMKYTGPQPVNKTFYDPDIATGFDTTPYPDYDLYEINSKLTPTDYIGAININVPTEVDDDFINFSVLDMDTKTFKDLFDTSDTAQKIINVSSNHKLFRVPANCFNTVLTSQADIIANGGNLIKKYNDYYVKVSPKFIEAAVLDIRIHNHMRWQDKGVSAEYVDTTNLDSNVNRRTIIDLDKTHFSNTPWLFENNPEQSGRLYGSVVEIWDTNGTILKQVKVINENRFNFSNSLNVECVMSPDIIGYEAPNQEITTGDIVRIYPRETYFNSVLFEISYKDESKELKSLISFMVNDIVRDMKTGIFEVYNNAGVTITDGVFDGIVEQRYQIFQEGHYEVRKVLKK